MTKYLRVQFTCDVHNPALPVSMFHVARDFVAPSFQITRDGDTVRVEHAAGSIEVPWSQVAWAMPEPVSEATSEERPKAKKVSK